jgi:hypothetical protein
MTDLDALTTCREGTGLVASDDDNLAHDVSSPLIPYQGLRYYCMVLTRIQIQNLIQMTNNGFVA